MERSVQIAIEHVRYCRSLGMGRADISGAIDPTWRSASWDDLIFWLADQWEALAKFRSAA